MTSFALGEVVVLPFTYADLTDRKRRPAIVLLDTGDEDILVAKVTTKQHDSGFDLPIEFWKDAGLLAPSYIRVHKLLAVEKVNVLQRIGKLQDVDLQRLRKAFRNLI